MSPTHLLTIQVYTADGHVNRFAQNDPQMAQHILDQINPNRVFQHNLILQGEKETSIFPHTAVVRIDLLMDGYPPWPFHHNMERVMQITETEFQERSQQAYLARRSGVVPRPGEIVWTFGDITLSNAERVWSQFEVRVSETTPLDFGMLVQQISTAPSQYIMCSEGGAILINSAHIMRLNVYPGPPHIPGAWPATLL